MAITKLRTDYKDDILSSARREYEMVQNSNGTVSFEDVSPYAQVGDFFGGEDINATNAAVNGLIDSAGGDFVLTTRTLAFNAGNVCSIPDGRITANSLANVYFTSATIATAEKAVMTVETYDGRVDIMAGRKPEGPVSASIWIRVVE